MSTRLRQSAQDAARLADARPPGIRILRVVLNIIDSLPGLCQSHAWSGGDLRAKAERKYTAILAASKEQIQSAKQQKAEISLSIT